MKPADESKTNEELKAHVSVEMPDFWAALKTPPPQWEPDDCSPPVDRELVERVVRRHSDEREAREVASLVVTYRPWMAALQTVIREDILIRYPRLALTRGNAERVDQHEPDD